MSDSSPEVQVYDGDGQKPKRRQKPRQRENSGQIRFYLDNFPVSFKYSSKIKEDEKGKIRQFLRFSGAGLLFTLNPPKEEAHPLTTHCLAGLFLSRGESYLHRAISNARRYGKRSLGTGVWPS